MKVGAKSDLKFVVAGNWKMFKNPEEASRFVAEIMPALQRQSFVNREYIIFAPALCLGSMSTGSHQPIRLGAQNCFWFNEGAFTGENSPRTLKEMGVVDCLVGHSERRQFFSETDEGTGKKVAALLAAGVRPMLCVGETRTEREAGHTDAVICRQLRAGLAQVKSQDSVVVAYEPVWAIGTGLVATPEQANQAHQVLRSELKTLFSDDFAMRTPILYGGSVKPDNAIELARQPEINGFLVGGASLKAADFQTLCLTPRK